MNDGKIKVLLIEDDKVDQIAFKRQVRELNLPYDYTISESISEGKQILASTKFDVVITDYFLGNGTGFDLFGSVPNTPIILITGVGDEEVAVKALKAGAYDYLIKDSERNYLKVLPVTLQNSIKHKKTEEHYKILTHAIMNINDNVYITDITDKIIFVNNSFCKTYGYEEEEILGSSSKQLWGFESSNESVKDRSKNFFDEHGQGEFYHIRKNGENFPVLISRSVIHNDSGKEIAIVIVGYDISERKLAEQERENLITDLQDALAKVKKLSGLLPICASCKKIRDDQGYWNKVEDYIYEHAEVEFSHGICPDCMQELYPEFIKRKKSRLK